MLAAPAAQGYSTNAELFLLLPSLCGIYLLMLADDEIPGGARAIALGIGCGFCAALATLLKPSGLVMLALFGLWSLQRWHVERVLWPVWLRGLLALGGGFLLGVAPALIHGLLTVPDLYISAVLFYRVSHDSVFAAPFVYQLGALATNLLYLFAHLPILLLAIVGLWSRRTGQGDERQIFLWLWLLVAFGGAAMGGNWFMHYDQPLLAPLAITTALGVRELLRLVARRMGRRPGRYMSLGLWVLAPTLLAFTLLIAASEMLVQAPNYVASPPVSAQIANYLRAHTAPDDTVYVAYQLPAVYQLANRRPAACWLYYRELQRTPGAFAEQVAQLADPQTAPRYIVEAHPFDAFGLDQDGTLRAVVARDYILETTVDNTAIFRRRAEGKALALSVMIQERVALCEGGNARPAGMRQQKTDVVALPLGE